MIQTLPPCIPRQVLQQTRHLLLTGGHIIQFLDTTLLLSCELVVACLACRQRWAWSCRLQLLAGRVERAAITAAVEEEAPAPKLHDLLPGVQACLFAKKRRQ
jgi:hypothetical protein